MEQELQNVEWVATCWEALVGGLELSVQFIEPGRYDWYIYQDGCYVSGGIGIKTKEDAMAEVLAAKDHVDLSKKPGCPHEAYHAQTGRIEDQMGVMGAQVNAQLDKSADFLADFLNSPYQPLILPGGSLPEFVVNPTVPPGQVYLMSEGDLKGTIENVGTKQPEEDDGA